ncbi:hypothetical protein FNU76_01640 [Chitinimonas arctica]|uniref:Uncharacterized protein n=1 Tax=Chitinimonas arctica TaxID=2594795 RepID=A0A516SAI4_9NEIS|nr:hypothetical protein [Chitinimonas arctica]QDQ25162.1 hypothetical protein FNU76_01640 [Chitinimonas arctica]
MKYFLGLQIGSTIEGVITNRGRETMLIRDSETHCALHSTPLLQDVVLIKYGLYRYESEYRTAHNTLFPKSHFYMLGGCMRGEALWRTVRYCPECRAQHLEWCTMHACTTGLPPTRMELESLFKRHFGQKNYEYTTPPEVHRLLLEGGDVRAIKMLKTANPDVEIADLRLYATYLRKKAAYEKALLEINSIRTLP